MTESIHYSENKSIYNANYFDLALKTNLGSFHMQPFSLNTMRFACVFRGLTSYPATPPGVLYVSFVSIIYRR